MIRARKKPEQETTDETPAPPETFQAYPGSGYSQTSAPAHAIPAPTTSPAPAPQPVAPRIKQQSARRTNSLTLYDKVMNKAGLSLGILLCVVLWGAGGYFTLVWLRSFGLPVEIFSPPAILTLWWFIPVGITILEIGLDPDRSPYQNKHSFWAWIFFLAIDTLATAAGIVSIIQGSTIGSFPIQWYLAWLIGAFVGLALARYPEKFGRGLWRDLLR